jgi:hypothetical protein
MNKSKEKALRKERSMAPTRHHILNRCRTDLFNNLSDKKNVVTLPEVYHFNHHVSQKNNAPHETLHFYRFFTQVMSPKAIEIYQALLKMSLEVRSFMIKGFWRNNVWIIRCLFVCLIIYPFHHIRIASNFRRFRIVFFI